MITRYASVNHIKRLRAAGVIFLCPLKADTIVRLWRRTGPQGTIVNSNLNESLVQVAAMGGGVDREWHKNTDLFISI